MDGEQCIAFSSPNMNIVLFCSDFYIHNLQIKLGKRTQLCPSAEFK